MKKVSLTEHDLEYIKSFVKRDIIESATNISFFYEMKLEPRDFIDQMTALAKMLEMDYWEIINESCTKVESKRMFELYEGRCTLRHIADEIPEIKIIKQITNKRLRQDLSLAEIKFL